jgi:hypothetical protein
MKKFFLSGLVRSSWGQYAFRSKYPVDGKILSVNKSNPFEQALLLCQVAYFFFFASLYMKIVSVDI